MARLSKTAALVSAKSRTSRVFGAIEGLVWLGWEGVTQVADHLVLKQIADRLESTGTAVKFLESTVAHPWLFLGVLVMAWATLVLLKTLLSKEEKGDKDGGDSDVPRINQRAHSGNASAGSVGIGGHISGDRNIIGGVIDARTIIYPSSSPAYPQLSITKWMPIPENHALAGRGQTGFEIVNDGGAVAYDASVETFEVEDGVVIKSAVIERIEANGTSFAIAWIDGYGRSPVDSTKWKLLDAMRRASSRSGVAAYQPNYTRTVSIVYRDAEEHWFRSFAPLNFIPSQNRLTLGSTRHSPRLRCNIREGFFHYGDRSRLDQSGTSRSELFVTFLLELVNDGIGDLSITDLDLIVRNGSASKKLAHERVVLPHPHKIKRTTPYHLGVEGITRAVEERLDDFSFPFTITPNRPVSGLVQFILRDHEEQKTSKFQDTAEFILEFLDARDNRHRLARPVGQWDKTGELIPGDHNNRETASTPAAMATDGPILTVVKYGRLSREQAHELAKTDYKEGLFIHNDGATAHKVTVENLIVGTWIVTFNPIDIVRRDETGIATIDRISKIARTEDGQLSQDAQRLETAWHDALQSADFETVDIRVSCKDPRQHPHFFSCLLKREQTKRNDAPFTVFDCRAGH